MLTRVYMNHTTARQRIIWATCTNKKFFSICSENADHTSHLRLAHASEIFRSSFYEAKHVSTSVSCLDLDQLIVSERARPSLLILPFELAGKTLGVIAKYSPSNISSSLLEVVDEATIQIYNDSIRDMQHMENNNNENTGSNDVKEALKYHREIKASAPSETGEGILKLSIFYSNNNSYVRNIIFKCLHTNKQTYTYITNANIDSLYL